MALAGGSDTDAFALQWKILQSIMNQHRIDNVCLSERKRVYLKWQERKASRPWILRKI